MTSIATLCVYCGSARGRSPAIEEATVALGLDMAERGVGLVYGGGAVGLMGLLADTVMGAGGRVVGVIPRGLFSREVAHRSVTELVEVASMHERKQVMFDRADAFVALPGGLGTLEELAEVATWGQLGIHRKPIAVLDVEGFWTPLLRFLERGIELGFVKERNRSLISRVERVEDLFDALGRYHLEPTTVWLRRDEL
jgi:uncharacterized protein (TIGR00730 family)